MTTTDPNNDKTQSQPQGPQQAAAVEGLTDEEQLQELRALLIKRFTEALRQPDQPASLLQAAAKFISDQKVQPKRTQKATKLPRLPFAATEGATEGATEAATPVSAEGATDRATNVSANGGLIGDSVNTLRQQRIEQEKQGLDRVSAQQQRAYPFNSDGAHNPQFIPDRGVTG